MTAASSREVSKTRYLAFVPWLGPVLGGALRGQQSDRVSVAAAADPLLGPPFAALLVPVQRTGDRLLRAGDGWVAEVAANGSAPLRLAVPSRFWADAPAGLLMLLLYDRSAGWRDTAERAPVRTFAETLAEQLECVHGARTLAAEDFIAIPRLPPPMREEVERRLRGMLPGPASALSLGVAENCGPGDSSQLVFAVGSCQYPAGFLDGAIAERSYRRLAQRLDHGGARSRPQCVLLLGDQVYLDATAGLFDPSTLYDRYELPYEKLFRIEPLRHVLRRIPAYTMLDDHEIEDNWEPGSGSADALAQGRHWYITYQRMADAVPPAPQRLWYPFEANGFPFFVCDTRTQREPRTARNVRRAHIMGPDQLAELLGWLRHHARDPRPKFIASPASFLPRHRRATHGATAGALRSDAWDGYPASFAAVVECIAAMGIRNVVFLSGDEHISFATTAIIRAQGAEAARIHSIHSSGLYAPFAFANATRDSLGQDECFDCGPYALELRTVFAPPGDGFTLLRVSGEDAAWRVEYLFDRERPPGVPEAWATLPR